LHIGGVRTALYNWLLARQAGGAFVLRIDDTDQQRNVAEALAPILKGFRWLGLQWDEGPEIGGPYSPYYQSQRGEIYRRYVDRLIAAGAAYRDYATPQEYQAEREAAEQARQPFVYSRRWLAENPAQASEFERQGRTAVVRLKMPREGRCEFTDMIRGPLVFEWSNEPDHVIQRADGSCLYNLASVVDDIELEITDVVRSIEHLSNTPRQVFMFQALGANLPRFSHLPYVAEPGSQNKLSKRKIASYLKNRDFKRLYDEGVDIAHQIGIDLSPESFNPVLVEFYESVGYLPGAILNYLLLLGWSLDDKTEEFTVEQMIRAFSLERVIKSPASFDAQKLTAFQARAMQRLSLEQRVDLVIPFLRRAGWVDVVNAATRQLVTQVVAAADQRLVVAGNILNYREFFLDDEQFPIDESAFDKRLRQPAQAGHLLNEFKKHLRATDDFSTAGLEQLMIRFVQQFAIQTSDVIHALRVALTGKSVGFGMFETMHILGPDRCLRRIDRALQRLATPSQANS
jgi:glutamyl-tRNA synthetase